MCAYRYAYGAPVGDEPYRDPETLMYLTSTSLTLGVVLSVFMIVIFAINDIWDYFAAKLDQRRYRKLNDDADSRRS